MAATERCVGCDKAASLDKGGHPIVAVMHVTDAEARGFSVQDQSARGFVRVPVCRECHVNPEHRVFAIKGHFFDKAAASTALHRAGSNRIGE